MREVDGFQRLELEFRSSDSPLLKRMPFLVRLWSERESGKAVIYFYHGDIDGSPRIYLDRG